MEPDRAMKKWRATTDRKKEEQVENYTTQTDIIKYRFITKSSQLFGGGVSVISYRIVIVFLFSV